MKADFIHNFVESLGFKGGCKKLAMVLLKTKEDCEYFYKYYYGKNLSAINDLLDYREYKVSISDMSFDKFINMCDNKVSREVFEHAFLQSFNQSEINLIKISIEDGVTSLGKIYEGFEANPNENILRNLL